jgi:3-deoxy-7-phosphoheptulonate synthase/chorismate mutase
MLGRLTGGAASRGAFGPAEIREIFQAVFRASLDIQDRERRKRMHVHRRDLVPAGGLRVADVAIGAGAPVLFVGPCSVETPEQMETVALAVARLPGPKVLRAGAFKPRTSPYSFQGLRERGLTILHETARRHGLATVTEVLDTSTLDLVAAHTDILQIGARNMYNTELLKAVGRAGMPVLLKRGFMATLEELLLSAEYILAEGNESIILCERGIRTFERWTRNTLDISAVPLLRQETSLPVIVDLSHSLGRKDVLAPCGRAALAAGADGLMIEIHPAPDQALSDGFQQLDLDGFAALVRDLGLASAAGTEGRPGAAIAVGEQEGVA